MSTTPILLVPSEEPKLNNQQILQAATNDPETADESFELGGKTFKIVDLDYDDYLEFVGFLQPVFDSVVGIFSSRANISIPDIALTPSTGFSAGMLLKFCKKELPQMACIVCRSTDKEVTVEWVKKNARTPFVLLAIVMKQITRNNIIQEFMSFFELILPTLQRMGLKTNAEEK